MYNPFIGGKVPDFTTGDPTADIIRRQFYAPQATPQANLPVPEPTLSELNAQLEALKR